MNTTTKKLSTLRMGTAALAGTVGLAVVGAVAPPIAFADSLQPGGSLTHQPAHYSQSLAIGWWIFIGAVTALSAVLGIYLVRKLRKSRREHYLWFAMAASLLADAIGEVRAGKSFIFDLIAVIAALYLGVHYFLRNRQLKR